MAANDPIIDIKFGHLMLLVGVAEIAIAQVCFFSKRGSTRIAQIFTNGV